MNRHFFLLCLLFTLSASVVCAQKRSAAISGMVTDVQGAPLKSATVFINGSTHITATNELGHYLFSALEPGNYQVTGKMLGHATITHEVKVLNESAVINFVLDVKPTMLNEVKVGTGNMDKFLEAFRKELLGSSVNGRSCRLLNPEVVNISTDKQFLKASADEFLIVENKRLGYKIRYALTYFNHELGTNRSTLSGEAVFEEMIGTEKEMKAWKKCRAAAYAESFRHFLKSIYSNRVYEEGFIAHEMLPTPTDAVRPDLPYIDVRPVKFDILASRMDTAYISLHFTSLYVDHNPSRASRLMKMDQKFRLKPIERSPTSTLIHLDNRQVMIDRLGNCINCSITFNGKWGLSRLGDQLPINYVPTM